MHFTRWQSSCRNLKCFLISWKSKLLTPKTLISDKIVSELVLLQCVSRMQWSLCWWKHSSISDAAGSFAQLSCSCSLFILQMARQGWCIGQVKIKCCSQLSSPQIGQPPLDKNILVFTKGTNSETWLCTNFSIKRYLLLIPLLMSFKIQGYNFDLVCEWKNFKAVALPLNSSKNTDWRLKQILDSRQSLTMRSY